MARLGEAWRRVLVRHGHRKKPSFFRLDYTPKQGDAVTVGFLRFSDGWWTFEYDAEYRRRPDLRPIEGFDDLNKIYRSRVLFPFFAVRVPDQDRHDIQRHLQKHKMVHPDESDLLRA